jgi:hypothetical protein
MGQIVKLIELLARLDELNSEAIIYACEPWTADSDAMVALEDPESGLPFGMPPEAAEAGMKYFLEVFTTREVVEGWLSNLDEKPTLAAICQRVIQYAIYDA